MGLGHSPSIVTNGLVLCLDAANVKSYPGSGTTWTDLSRNGNNGTLINGPTYSNGSIIFDGVNDQCNVVNNASLNFTNGITLSSWFNFSALPGGELGLFRKDSQWQLGLSGSNTIRCLIGTNIVSGWTASNDVVYPFLTNTWYNMVMTYNSSTMLIYVNGVLVKTATVTGTIITNGNNLQIGYHSSVLNGRLSNCSIYNRALSEAEVNQNFNALRGRFGV